jgi:methylated-DNA-protein-cysteine methyltransferase-like protein
MSFFYKVSMANISFFERVYEIVKQIPYGQVATYGQIGLIVSGSPHAARTVGWALHGLPAERIDEVPWWRVINAQGRISNSQARHGAAEQRRRLEAEGIAFDEADRTDLSIYQWDGEVQGESVSPATTW